MLKVANIIEEGRYGGPQARIVSVASALRDREIETIVILPDKGSDFFFQRLMEAGVDCRRVRLHRFARKKSDLIKSIVLFVPEVACLQRLFRRECVRVVHANSPWQFKGVIAGKLARANTIWHLNTTRTNPLLKWGFRVVSLFFCDGFMVAGARVKKYHLTSKWLRKKPVAEIQAPVNTSEFRPQTTKEDKFLSSFTGIKIVTVGNINRAKGLEGFVEMAASLSSKYKDLVFSIVGPVLESKKDYHGQLLQRIANKNLINIHFYGFADNVASVLKANDIYVCSSTNEASPTSVWEAMSMEKPIVSTDVGDVARFIRDRENGFVVPTGDPKALAEKVGLLIDDPELREEFGRKARTAAVKYLDVETCARKHAEFYRRIAQM